jgi:hypothetical protein
MARPTFLYYLFNENNRPMYVGANRFIYEADANWNRLDNGKEAHLKDSPEEWKDVLVKYGRNFKYWGMFRDLTIPLTFPGDGFDILVDRLRKHGGFEALCYIGILKLDRTSLPYTYRNWYLSELNFVKAEQFLDSMKIEALEGGLSKLLKANENTKYTIPIDADSQHITIFDDGMELVNTATWAITDGQSSNVLDLTYDFRNHIVDALLIQKEVEDIGGVFDVSRTKVNNNNPNIKATGQKLFVATSKGTTQWDWDFTLNWEYIPPPALNPGSSIFCALRIIKPDGTLRNGLFLLNKVFGQFGPGQIKVFPLKGSGTLDVEVGDEVFLYTGVSPEGATGDQTSKFTYSGSEPFLRLKIFLSAKFFLR